MRLAFAARLIPSSFVSQLLLLFAAAIVVPVVFTGLLIQSDINGAEQAGRNLALQQARHAAEDIEIAYTRDQELATILGGLSEFWNGSDEDRDRILAAFSSPYPFLNGLLYFTSDLAQHGKAGTEPGAARVSMAARKYAREAVQTNAPSFADEVVVSQTVSGQELLSLVIPLQEKGPGGRSGYLAAAFRSALLPTVWDTSSLPRDSTLLLVDTRSGRVLGGTAHNPYETNTVLDDSILDIVHSDSTRGSSSCGCL